MGSAGKAATVIGCLICTPVDAAQISIFFSGHVTDVVGSGWTSAQSGDRISGAFSYDTALAPPDSYPSPDSGGYLTDTDWISSVTTVNGERFSSAVNYSSLQPNFQLNGGIQQIIIGTDFHQADLSSYVSNGLSFGLTVFSRCHKIISDDSVNIDFSYRRGGCDARDPSYGGEGHLYRSFGVLENGQFVSETTRTINFVVDLAGTDPADVPAPHAMALFGIGVAASAIVRGRGRGRN